MSDEVSRQLLRQRARELARPLEEPTRPRNEVTTVVFHLGTEKYGLEAAVVQEVLPLKELTKVPCTPEFVKGIINLRGHILAVFDLGIILGVPAAPSDPDKNILVLKAGGREFGGLPDAVLGTRTFSGDSIQTGPMVFPSGSVRYLQGITSDGVILLHAQEMLADERLVIAEISE